MKFTISTEHNNHHQDFKEYELDELDSYLDTFDYYENSTLQHEVRKALENKASHLVEPVNGEEDITIDFTYL